MSSNTKQYGLVMPKKGSQGLLRPRPSAFDDDSDSSQEGGGDWVKKALKQESQKSTVKKQTQLEMQRAVQEDPTVYQYDEVYDKIEEKKMEQKAVKKAQDKKPRYIQSLLKEAERRKRDQERRNERLIQKEREAEGEQFKDKDAFVTSAYRDKLEEFRKLDEDEKRQDYIESLTDVSKQQDLSGFYRHLYRQTVTGEEVPGETKIKVEKNDGEPASAGKQRSEKNSETKSDETKPHESEKKGRQYRKRKASSSGSEGEMKDGHSASRKKEHKRKSNSDRGESVNRTGSKETRNVHDNHKAENANENIDADSPISSSSSSSSSSDSSSESESEKTKKTESVAIASGSEEGEIKELQVDPQKTDKEKAKSGEDRKESKTKKNEESSKEDGEGKEDDPKKEPEAPKLNIWAKRTVGVVFDAALERYYQRKASKLAYKG